ncbi:MAG: hypothetical protein IBJ18_13030 [Phycisphaerales bacterium]|nr:hypothetical protein [Phycisphaerales bacterium]
MLEITRLLRRAKRRLMLTRGLTGLVVLSTAAVICIAALIVVERSGLAMVRWDQAAIFGPIGLVVGTLLWALIRLPNQHQVARAVDEGANLKESLSTALHVANAADPWSKAVVASASSAAPAVNLKTAMPVRAPRHWPAPFIAAMAAFVLWIVLPSFDLLGKKAEAKKLAEDQKRAETQRQEAEKAKAQADKIVAKVDALNPEKGEGDKSKSLEENQALKQKNPEEIRRAAIRTLTSAMEKIDAAKQSATAQTTQTMLDKLKQLRTPGQGPLSELSSALSKGNIAEAKDQLDKLTQDLASSKLNETEKEKLAEQLDKMSKQLANLAKDQSALEKALKDAGIDPAAAKDAQQLAEALKNSDKLSEQQKQALQNLQQALQNSNAACQNMSESMDKMAQACKNPQGGQQSGTGQGQQANQQGQQGQQGQEGQQGEQGQQQGQGMSQQMAQAMDELSDQLSQMEMAEAEMKSMEATAAEAKQQLQALSEGMGQCDSPGMGAADKGGLAGNGAFKDGQSQGDGAGRGGPGISSGGGGMGEAAANESWKKIKAKTEDTGGTPIGTMLIQGEQVKGESRQQFATIAAAAEQEATEALENNVIERQYHDLVKHYFGQLAAKSNADNKPAPKPDAKSGVPAKDAPKP